MFEISPPRVPSNINKSLREAAFSLPWPAPQTEQMFPQSCPTRLFSLPSIPKWLQLIQKPSMSSLTGGTSVLTPPANQARWAIQRQEGALVINQFKSLGDGEGMEKVRKSEKTSCPRGGPATQAITTMLIQHPSPTHRMLTRMVTDESQQQFKTKKKP